MTPTALTRAARFGTLLLATIALSMLAAPPAGAHPFGDPQTLEVAGGDDGRVVLRWRPGGVDDLTLLGVRLGVLPRDRVLLDGAVLVEDGDGAVVAASAELAGYLLDRVRVRAGGDRCPGELLGSDPDPDGLELGFTCATGSDRVEVTARLLTDLHPAYRTLASGPDGQRAVYDEAHSRHEWTLTAGAGTTAASGLGRSAAGQVGGLLGAGLLAGLAAVGGMRWRAHRRSRP